MASNNKYLLFTHEPVAVPALLGSPVAGWVWLQAAGQV